MMLKRYILFLLIIGLSSLAIADKEYIREYTYNASENDSKVSARKAAMQQLQSLLIEELGVQVQSNFSNTEKLTGNEFSRTVKANYQTFSKALTKTRIIKQKWDGATYYVKAAISVNKSDLKNKIQVVYAAPQGGQVASSDPCKAMRSKVLALLENAHRPEPIQEAIALSKKHPFDNRCHDWQYSILSMFRSLSVDDDPYREFLFNTVKSDPSSFAGDLILDVLRYSLAVKPLTKKEFSIVLDAMRRGHKGTVFTSLGLLIRKTKKSDPGESIHNIKANNIKQNHKDLEFQLTNIIELARREELGSPKVVSYSEVSNKILTVMVKEHPDLFSEYYERHSHALTPNNKKSFGPKLFSFFLKEPNQPRLDMVNSYIKSTKMDKRLNGKVFSFFNKLKKEEAKNPFYTQALNSLVSSNKEKMADIILNARTNQKTKMSWLIEYDIPSDTVCELKACAKKLFDKKKSVQLEHAKYLVAYGKRAAPIEKQIIRRFARFVGQRPYQGRATFKIEMLKVLGNIETKNPDAINIVIKELGSLDMKVPAQAQETLVQIGTPSLAILKASYSQQKPLVQRRIVEALAQFQQNKKPVLTFLTTIKPANNAIQYAIEDATEALGI